MLAGGTGIKREWNATDGVMVYLALWGAILFLAGCTIGAVVVWIL